MEYKYLIKEVAILESQLVALHEAKHAEFRVARESKSADKALSCLEVKNIFDEIIDFITEKTIATLDTIDDSIGDLYTEWSKEVHGVDNFDWDGKEALEEKYSNAGEMAKYEIFSLSAMADWELTEKEWGWEINNGWEYPRPFMEEIIKVIKNMELNIRIEEI